MDRGTVMRNQKVAVSSPMPDYIADRIEEGYQNLRKFFTYVDDNMDYLSGVVRGTKTLDVPGVVGTGELHAIREHIVEFEREKRESRWKAAQDRLEKIKKLMKDVYPEGRRGVNSLIAELRGMEDRDAEKIAEGLRALKDGIRSASNGIQQAIEKANTLSRCASCGRTLTASRVEELKEKMQETFDMFWHDVVDNPEVEDKDYWFSDQSLSLEDQIQIIDDFLDGDRRTSEKDAKRAAGAFARRIEEASEKLENRGHKRLARDFSAAAHDLKQLRKLAF